MSILNGDDGSLATHYKALRRCGLFPQKAVAKNMEFVPSDVTGYFRNDIKQRVIHTWLRYLQRQPAIIIKYSSMEIIPGQSTILSINKSKHAKKLCNLVGKSLLLCYYLS